MTRRIWGYVHRGKVTKAAYFIEWVPDKVQTHGAAFDLILGKWGEGASPNDRVAVSLVMRRTNQGPQFMVVDAAGRFHDDPTMTRAALGRNEVVGRPIAKDAFAVIDAVWLADQRIADLVAGAS